VVAQTEDRVILDIRGHIAESLIYVLEVAAQGEITVELSIGLQQIVKAYQGEQGLIDHIGGLPSSGEGDDAPAVPGLKPSVQLLPHQRRGLGRALAVRNLAEFSVQGSGKTLTAAAAFAVWRQRGEVTKLLVIGPLSSFQPWEDELHRYWNPPFSTLRWSGAASQRMSLVPAFAQADVVVCSYDTARRDVDMLAMLLDQHRTMLVLDESHYIKNFSVGARGAAALRLAPHAAVRMILTGTPTPHSLLDLWAQIAFLWPAGFRTVVGTPQQYIGLLSSTSTPAATLRARLTPFFHRTTQSELHLPEAQSHFVQLPIQSVPRDQILVIRLLETRIAAEARSELPHRSDRTLLARWQRARIIRLLQASSNPGLLLGRLTAEQDHAQDFPVDDLRSMIGAFQTGEVIGAKLAWTAQKARELIGRGHKVLIWSWWVDNLHLLSRLLAEVNPLLLYGAVKPYEEEGDDLTEAESRERNIREFKTREDRPLLIANPAACAESISLHHVCHDAIYVERTFNCGQFLQSLNRIHRVGLPEGTTTNYWIPLLDCAIERAVDQRLRTRQQTMYDFLGDNAPVFGAEWDEDTLVADSDDEVGQAFDATLQQIHGGTLS
jgi:SNF2 family DNA or RNA helicase